jgi:general stress protein 26
MHARPIRFVLALLVTGAALATPHAAGQAPASPDRRAAVVAAARTIIDTARYATLITLDGSGHPQARVVDPLAPDADLTIWIGTNPQSRKVGQIARDRRVTLLYFDRAGESYVTVIGSATAVGDPREKARRWKDEWTGFYKDGNRGDDFLLIRVEPSRLEVSSAALGMANDPTTWRPVILDLR